MGFRDDELASQARTEALEQEVERLKAENATLRERAEAPAAGERRARSTPARWAGSLAIVALVAAIGAAVAPLPPQLRMVLALVCVLAVTLAVMAKVVGGLLHVVEPGELLVLSGVRRVGPDGQERPYRVVTSGRVLQTPLLETASWMALGPFPLTLELRGIYAKREPVDLRASATIAVSTDPDLVTNAIDRFLGRGSDEMVEVARQTIEGALRSVASAVSAEALREDPLRVADLLAKEGLEADMETLGLRLETFVIEEVSPS